MNLEGEAIKLICSVEPKLERTPPNNPGFDLVERNDTGEAVKWVEVIAMKEDLHQRPVGISRTQFEYAQQHREGYWLYIVGVCGDTGKGSYPAYPEPSRQGTDIYVRPRLGLGG